jgi:anti-sigma B factor antagonist
VTADDKDPASLLAVAVTHAGRWMHVDVAGDIDASTADHLRTTLLNTIDLHRPQVVTIDLARVAFLDASGITALVAVYIRLADERGELRLINPKPLVATVLRIVELSALFNVSCKPQPAP